MSRQSPALRAWLPALAVCTMAVSACAEKKAPALPPAGAPRYPEYIIPAVPAQLGTAGIAERHNFAWRWFQAGDLREAERSFSSIVRQAPEFYPSETGLGYVALVRKDEKAALSHFDRAIVVNPRYAPALAGRGEALLALKQNEGALASFESALAADPELGPLKSRIELLRFQALRGYVDAAQKSAAAGRLADAREAYEHAIMASPQSAFLYRELATVERRDGNLTQAQARAEAAVELDPNDTRGLIVLGEVYEAQQEFGKAVDMYSRALAIEPSEMVETRIDDLRAKAAFAAMPAEYRSIETSPTVSRAQLAALLGVRLDVLLKRAGRHDAVLITDMRGSWAAPWIMSVARTGLMEVYPNHTFQPSALVRRGDLAEAASRVLSLIATDNPRLAASWRAARRKFTDLAPGHLSYPAASLAVEAGVMTTLEQGTFQLTRPVTGADAVAAVKKLEELSERRR